MWYKCLHNIPYDIIIAMKKSYSQSYQDFFVLSMLQEKIGGFYVEIGGYDAKSLSNTYLLETDYKWKGFALEINEKRASKYNLERHNPCILADAINFDYRKAFKLFNAPKQIDYLQLDIEPSPNTLECLYNVPMEYRYSVITFEHDLYAHPEGQIVQQNARKYLQENGYKLVVGNAYAPKNIPSPFEDWFIDPSIIDKSIYKNFISENIQPKKLFS